MEIPSLGDENNADVPSQEAEVEKIPELTRATAAEAFAGAFEGISGSGLNDTEKTMLEMMRHDIDAISVNALNADNSYERFRSEEWAIEGRVEKDAARQFAARVYREAAQKAVEMGFDGTPLINSAEFFEGTRYDDGVKKEQE